MFKIRYLDKFKCTIYLYKLDFLKYTNNFSIIQYYTQSMYLQLQLIW